MMLTNRAQLGWNLENEWISTFTKRPRVMLVCFVSIFSFDFNEWGRN